jgi:hypothetical protein
MKISRTVLTYRQTDGRVWSPRIAFFFLFHKWFLKTLGEENDGSCHAVTSVRCWRKMFDCGAICSHPHYFSPEIRANEWNVNIHVTVDPTPSGISGSERGDSVDIYPGNIAWSPRIQATDIRRSHSDISSKVLKVSTVPRFTGKS